MPSLNPLHTTELAPKTATLLLNLTTHHLRDLAAIELRTLVFLLAHINPQGQYLLDLQRLPKSKTKQPDPIRQQQLQLLAEKHHCPLVTLADFRKCLGMSPSTVLRILRRLTALRLISPGQQAGTDLTLRQLTIPDHPLDQIPLPDSDNDSLDIHNDSFDNQQPDQSADDLYPEAQSDDPSEISEIADSPNINHISHAPPRLPSPDQSHHSTARIPIQPPINPAHAYAY